MADPGYTWRDGHPQRKQAWRVRLQSGPVICGYQGCLTCGTQPCGQWVYAQPEHNWDGNTWHLGHTRALKHGGNGADSAPWHQTCNLRDAACLTNHGSKDAPEIVASRDWWG